MQHHGWFWSLSGFFLCKNPAGDRTVVGTLRMTCLSEHEFWYPRNVPWSRNTLSICRMIALTVWARFRIAGAWFIVICSLTLGTTGSCYKSLYVIPMASATHIGCRMMAASVFDVRWNCSVHTSITLFLLPDFSRLGRPCLADPWPGACFTKQLMITIKFYPAHYSLIRSNLKTILIVLKWIKTDKFESVNSNRMINFEKFDNQLKFWS
jgi:hypothetical protein